MTNASSLKALIASGYAVLALTTPAIALSQAHGHSSASPSDMKWADLPSLPPGAKIAVLEGPMNEAVPFTARLKLPAGYQIPAHWHPATERITVLSGTFYMGMGDVLAARHRWTTCRKPSTRRSANGWPTTGRFTRSWRRSPRSTTNYYGGESRSEAQRWARRNSRSPSPSISPLVRCCWPTCS